MYLLAYLMLGFSLLRCTVDREYRAKSVRRWKQSRPNQVVLEIGGGLAGLLMLAAVGTWVFRRASSPAD